MYDKIYDEYKKEKSKASQELNAKLNELTEPQIVISDIPKKNLNINQILINLGLIDDNPENIAKINEFYDMIFKVGIEIGIGTGKSTIVNLIRKDEITMDFINEINPQNYIDFVFEPTVSKY